MRMTLERAIAANVVPPERPLVLVKSPWGNARVLPAQGDARVVLLSHAEIAQLAQRHGTFLYIYLRLENREGSHKVSIDQQGIEPIRRAPGCRCSSCRHCHPRPTERSRRSASTANRTCTRSEAPTGCSSRRRSSCRREPGARERTSLSGCSPW